MSRIWLLAVLTAVLGLQLRSQEYIGRLSTGEVWRQHLLNDLLPWWTAKEALGAEPGSFPTVRCDDGSIFDEIRPCPEVVWNTWINPREQSLVALSRQVYAYGVAFHMTGDPAYLTYMKEGVDYIRAHAIDSAGGMYTVRDAKGTWGPLREFRNPQELGYGLLGMAFYYYLTRDPDVLPDILTGQWYILHNYYSLPLGAVQWVLADGPYGSTTDQKIVAQLDQMNTYHVLLAPILPDAAGEDWKWALHNLSQILISHFYSPDENVFFLSANSPRDLDLRYSGTDFGHTAKAMWMIRFAARMNGETALVQWAEENGKRLLERAYLADSGSWAEGLLAGGAIDANKSWWIYAELDQFAATLALTDAVAGRYLPDTHGYWLRYFVDREHGEVWNGVEAGTNMPQRSLPKQWAWKNGYHSLEHALVSYVACQQLHSEPVTLYFAFKGAAPDAARVRPYFFTGKIESAEKQGIVTKVVFRDVQ